VTALNTQPDLTGREHRAGQSFSIFDPPRAVRTRDPKSRRGLERATSGGASAPRHRRRRTKSSSERGSPNLYRAKCQRQDICAQTGERYLRMLQRVRLSLSEIKYERSDDAGRQGRASLRCCRGGELVASSAHPCSRTGVFGSDCSSSHNSVADGEDGALQRQSRATVPSDRTDGPLAISVLPG
jgi:hypothetical protein